jgi:nitrogen fixation NifU-like protein
MGMVRMVSDAIQELFMDHYLHPRNFGPVEGPHFTGEAENRVCGDRITIHLVIEPISGRIEKAMFQGEACLISIVSASVLTERVKGRPRKEAGLLGQAELLDLLDAPLSPIRRDCALVPLNALRNALRA